MSDSSDNLRARLHAHDQSMTAVRQAVFSAIQENGPLTMAELIRRCSSIDRASIYRTITLFEKLGIVQRMQIGWKYRLELSDDFQRHHHHLHCNDCGSITPLPEDTQLENRLLALTEVHKFEIIDHQIEIRGICQNCRQLRNNI